MMPATQRHDDLATVFTDSGQLMSIDQVRDSLRIPSPRSARAAAGRNLALIDDATALEHRVNTLTLEVMTLTGRRDGLAGYGLTAPLSGLARYHEMAGMAAGSAISRGGDSDLTDIAAATRDVAGSVGSKAQISALIDLAGAALARAAALSLGDEEQSAAVKVRPPINHSRHSSPQTGVNGRPRVAKDLARITSGEISLDSLLTGRLRAAIRRDFGVFTVARLLYALPGQQFAALQGHPALDVRLGDLTAEERHDLVVALHGASA